MRKLLVFAAFAAMTVAVAACTGDDDDDGTTPTPSPSPSPSPTAVAYDVTVGAAAWPHAFGGVRVLQGANVVACSAGTFASGTTWSITWANIITNATLAYSVEVWGDANGDSNYDVGGATDHEWLFGRGANTMTDSNIQFNHGDTQTNITWANNTVCPG